MSLKGLGVKKNWLAGNRQYHSNPDSVLKPVENLQLKFDVSEHIMRIVLDCLQTE
jgi:hypothetical protein